MISKINNSIKLNEYLKFINENINLTECSKDMIINCFKNKYLIYIDSHNLFQMNYYYKKAIENQNRDSIYFLESLLLNFTNI